MIEENKTLLYEILRKKSLNLLEELENLEFSDLIGLEKIKAKRELLKEIKEEFA